MALIPITESLSELSAIEKANIGKYLYEEAKAGAFALSKTLRNRKRRSRQRMRKATSKSSASPMSSARPMMSTSTMTAPVAYGQRVRQDYSGLGAYVVKHAEYLSDISGSSDFSIRRYRINAADPFTFPWLSNISSNFEKYRFRKIRFTLKPQAPSTTPGVVMMAFDYDPTDPAPLSKADMLQYDGAVRVNSWGSLDMSMKPAPALLTARAPPTASADLRLTDAANLFIATQGQLDTNPISELWAEYEIELLIPQSNPTCDAFTFACDGWTGADFLSASIANNSVNFELIYDASEVRVLRSGQYAITAYEFQISPVIDVTIDPVEELGIELNGAPVPTYRAAGPAAALPSQNEATAVTNVTGVSLAAGDILSFVRSPTTTGTARLRCVITNLS